MTSYLDCDYEAFGKNGAYVRKALVIGELPPELTLMACRDATAGVSHLLKRPSKRRIYYGASVYLAFDMTPAEANTHAHAAMLMLRGDELPLTLCALGVAVQHADMGV